MVKLSEVSLDDVNARWLPALERSLGVRVTGISETRMQAEYTVNEMMLQPFGIMHGGIHCVLAESIGSMAGSITAKEGMTVVGQGLQAQYFRPAKLGTAIVVTAEALHNGSRSQVWEIVMTARDTGKLLAKCTLTLAVVDIASLKTQEARKG